MENDAGTSHDEALQALETALKWEEYKCIDFS
ncbi:unnamed protein product [Parnassius apollo]|uniref:(apollo) hypothetical protein n=1 Tax=Parnassius apollo TaxID=110799 RepID=A0A8S3WSU5_PARAO|nr:unnamed protein product [Parnassius apollo]